MPKSNPPPMTPPEMSTPPPPSMSLPPIPPSQLPSPSMPPSPPQPPQPPMMKTVTMQVPMDFQQQNLRLNPMAMKLHRARFHH